MRALIQRVSKASVHSEGEQLGDINAGLLVLLGVEAKDDEASMQKLLDRCMNYRIFADDKGRMNNSLLQSGGEMLLVSQFTLCADTRQGLRPGFSHAAPPDMAKALYDQALAYAASRLGKVESGRFGADMQVSLINDGPVTFMLEV